jgi:hypothetical protein
MRDNGNKMYQVFRHQHDSADDDNPHQALDPEPMVNTFKMFNHDVLLPQLSKAPPKLPGNPPAESSKGCWQPAQLLAKHHL